MNKNTKLYEEAKKAIKDAIKEAVLSMDVDAVTDIVMDKVDYLAMQNEISDGMDDALYAITGDYYCDDEYSEEILKEIASIALKYIAYSEACSENAAYIFSQCVDIVFEAHGLERKEQEDI